jgi:hypothetical protein
MTEWRKPFFSAVVFRWLPLTAIVLIVIFVAKSALFAPSYFADDRYNLGVVRRSVLPGARYALESSLVHVFFEPYSLPRPEDWHRSLPLLLLTVWARVVGSENDLLLRVPHLLWILAWLYLSFRLLAALQRTSRVGSAETPALRLVSWPSIMLSSALVLNAWAMNMLRRAYLDDFPATVCVLAAVLLLIEGRRSSMLQVSAAGGLCGMSFLMKDFSLIWGPIGLAVVVALGLGGQGQLAFKEVVSRLRAFGAGYATLVAPKMIWSWIELGGALENPVRYWLLAKYFGTRPIDSHYPFFLYHDPSYSSRVALSGGMVPAVMNFRRPLTGLLLTLGALSFVWLWLAPVLVSLVFTARFSVLAWGKRPNSAIG